MRRLRRLSYKPILDSKMEAFWMPVNLSIKNVPDELAALLKERAQRNHRSMQREMLAILDEAVRMPRRLTPDEVLARARMLGLSADPTSAAIVRADRDRR
jgi:plasmid stability protein